jgi:cell division protein FtsL
MFWLVLVLLTGFVMFGVKYAVQSLEDELNRIKKATIAEEHAIRTNEAEWAYLTRPETLEEMNRHYLSLGPIATKQLRLTVIDIPLRPQPAPPADPSPAAAPAPENGLSPPEAPIAAATQGMPAVAAAPESSDAVAAAAPEKPAHTAEPAKPNPTKTAGKPATLPRRPTSLDELIAQVAASR